MRSPVLSTRHTSRPTLPTPLSQLEDAATAYVQHTVVREGGAAGDDADADARAKAAAGVQVLLHSSRHFGPTNLRELMTAESVNRLVRRRSGKGVGG